MVPKFKKSYFSSGADYNILFHFTDFVKNIKNFTFRTAPPAGVERRLVRELLISIERLVVAVFGASTFILLLLESVLGAATTFESVCTALCFVAVITVFFAAVRMPGRGIHLYYSVFYVLTFLIVSHMTNANVQNAAADSAPYLLYIAFSLSQALRAGRMPGLPVVAFLIGHWSVFKGPQFFSKDFADLVGEPVFRGGFTFAWASVFALFIETVLFFAVVRYLELLARRRKEDADLTLARRVHESLFPAFVENEHLKLHVYRSPENHTGGDFYDLLHMREGNLGFFFADVSGHGISSAMMSAAMKVLLATLPYRLRLRPADLLDHLDDTLSREFNSHHASGVYMYFDFPNRQILMANDGHPPVLYSPAGEPFRELQSDGSVLGYRIQRPIAGELALPMRSGDRYFFYTDGLTEYQLKNGAALDLSADFSMEDIFAGIAARPAVEILSAVLSTVRGRPDFGRFRDDVMLALIEIK